VNPAQLRRRFAFAFLILSILLVVFLLVLKLIETRPLQFQVEVSPNLSCEHFTGRLAVVVSSARLSDGRMDLTRNGGKAFCLLGTDVNDFGNGKVAIVKQSAVSYPLSHVTDLPAGHYFVGAYLKHGPPLSSPDSPGTFFSSVREFDIDPARAGVITLWLDQPAPPETVPADTAFMNFLKVKSDLLSKFHGRPMYLRAGIVLPSDYYEHPDRRYPVWVRIGGYGARYWSIKSLMDEKSDFRKTWDEADTPRMILVQLDGAGPYGDPYQVNSANNGPYGDALMQELLPEVEKRFRCLPHARVLSGVSTGGWASLALQIFYPDEFDGVWSSCPDPVDFRAFELINIYENTNAYVNAYGFERPSERTVDGEVKLTVRREVQLENVLGRGDSWTLSGEQWCAWNAVFSPRGKDGLPERLWDPQTGAINRAVAEAWKRYDLRLCLQEHWKTLGPKLQGKLHIAAGDADNFYLNNAVHLLDEFLSHANPPYKGTIVYGPRKGHGWSNLAVKPMLQEMQAAVERVNRVRQPSAGQ
jgi:S-formylglutathione hydrolase FrmB